MTTTPKAPKFRIRRAAPPPPPPPATDDGFGPEPFPTAEQDMLKDPDAPAEGALDAIRAEGLTGRQLRLARRVAQNNGIETDDDLDAVRQLRARGIDPFQKSSVLELVAGAQVAPASAEPRAPQLPQTVRQGQNLPGPRIIDEGRRAAEVMKIQRDIARRRRRKLGAMLLRIAVLVFLPTFVAGWYYFRMATPLYSTRSEFVIQQAEAQAAGGLGSIFRGTQFATSQDSITVQSYLTSRDAMLRLDEDLGFKAHFSDPSIDPVQRLDEGATNEAAYKIYKRNVKIGYDPTEGIIKMEVIAADPAVSQKFSEALIGYAEEQVDHLTQRLREDQMKGARESYEKAEADMLAAQRKVVELQERFKVLSSEQEMTLITSRIAQLEGQLSTDRLSLQQMEANAQPNQARMDPLKRRIAVLEGEIATLRAKMTEDGEGGMSLAKVQSELLVAEADVQTRQMLLTQSLQSLETARVEANRQVRYLSLAVSPVAPDEATYPRAFENTMVALLIFAGIYLMISMTAAILREQVAA